MTITQTSLRGSVEVLGFCHGEALLMNCCWRSYGTRTKSHAGAYHYAIVNLSFVAQGHTYNKPVAIHLGKDKKSQGLSYTAFSRATKLSLIRVAGGMVGNRLTSKIADRSDLQKRKREDRRLSGLQADMEQQQAQE